MRFLNSLCDPLVGNDELEDDMTGFEAEELSESLDESQILPVPTDENAKFCADSASMKDVTQT